MEFAHLLEVLTEYVPSTDLDPNLLTAVDSHLMLLERWNQHMNLTAVREREMMIRRHFGESLFAARQLLSRTSASSLIDVGSGAGFPGLPCKYWSPELTLTLIEGHGKKATFLREVCRATKVDRVSVANVRAEAFSGQAELVTMRAVEHFEKIVPMAIRLISPGGQLALLIGESQCEGALALLPGHVASRINIPASESRVLLIWKKSETII